MSHATHAAAMTGDHDAAHHPHHHHHQRELDVFRVRLGEISTSFVDSFLQAEIVVPFANLQQARMSIGNSGLAVYALREPHAPPESVRMTVRVATTSGPARSLREIVSGQLPSHAADTANFYSICDWHANRPGADRPKGSGLGGRFLAAVKELIGRENPHIGRYVTMSPVYSLRDATLRSIRPVLTNDGKAILNSVLASPHSEALSVIDDHTGFFRGLAAVHITSGHWVAKPHSDERVFRFFDAAAHVHAGNGAVIRDVTPAGADDSDKGHAQSWGIMGRHDYTKPVDPNDYRNGRPHVDEAVIEARRQFLRDFVRPGERDNICPTGVQLIPT